MNPNANDFTAPQELPDNYTNGGLGVVRVGSFPMGGDVTASSPAYNGGNALPDSNQERTLPSFQVGTVGPNKLGGSDLVVPDAEEFGNEPQQDASHIVYGQEPHYT